MTDRAAAYRDAAAQRLRKYGKRQLMGVEAFDFCRGYRLRYAEAEHLIHAEQLRRGLIGLADLAPHQRRGLVDPASIDLHELASWPIMDAAALYLPAGKLSMAETRAREAAQLLPETPDFRTGPVQLEKPTEPK